MPVGHFSISGYLQKIYFSAFQYLPDEVPEDPHIVGFLFWDLICAFMESEMIPCDCRPVRGF